MHIFSWGFDCIKIRCENVWLWSAENDDHAENLWGNMVHIYTTSHLIKKPSRNMEVSQKVSLSWDSSVIFTVLEHHALLKIPWNFLLKTRSEVRPQRFEWNRTMKIFRDKKFWWGLICLHTNMSLRCCWVSLPNSFMILKESFTNDLHIRRIFTA